MRIQLVYPARLTKGHDGYAVTFRDVPEAQSAGRSKSKAREMAADALRTAIEFYLEERRAFPLPSKMEEGEFPVLLQRPLQAS